MRTETKYLIFEELEPKPKTKHFSVENKSGLILGEIKWHGQWRKYCFFTSDIALIFDAGCLGEIKDFLDKLMSAHKLGNELVKEIKNGKI